MLTKTFADFGIDTRGKVSGEIKTTCPMCSASRRKRNYPCLNVNLDKGLFHCWHCEWAGGLSVGIQRRPEVVRTWRKPDYVAKSEGLPPEVAEWFAARGIGVDGVVLHFRHRMHARAGGSGYRNVAGHRANTGGFGNAGNVPAVGIGDKAL